MPGKTRRRDDATLTESADGFEEVVVFDIPGSFAEASVLMRVAMEIHEHASVEDHEGN